ncbi:MAG: hypothetical protein J6K43_01635 [Lachnospiraceae bacterium]|nr:hypothetical protein [Lachnospiraceae bacterium]
MFKYNIHNTADNGKFKAACEKIESSIKDLNIEKPLVDVDGSIIQIYNSGNDKIKVYNDYEVDAVYIDSEVNLDKLFS